MTKVLKGHFDGRVIVPEVPVDLPRNQRLIIRVEPEQEAADAEHGTAAYVAGHIQPVSDEDAELMKRAIEEGCENIGPDPDVNLD